MPFRRAVGLCRAREYMSTNVTLEHGVRRAREQLAHRYNQGGQAVEAHFVAVAIDMRLAVVARRQPIMAEHTTARIDNRVFGQAGARVGRELYLFVIGAVAR